MDNLLKEIEILRERVQSTWRLLDIDSQMSERAGLRRQMQAEGFWNDQEKAVETGKRYEELDHEIKEWEVMKREVTELEEIVAVAAKEGDTSLEEDARDQYAKLKEKFTKLEFYVLFSGKYDRGNAILSVHAGTGGVDAQDWAEMLERMFLRFAEKMGWHAEILDRNTGNEAGIKSTTMHIKGRWAYGYLKSESGVHRLVRISPYDAEAMRHTSFALVEVIPELPEAAEIELNDAELENRRFPLLRTGRTERQYHRLGRPDQASPERDHRYLPERAVAAPEQRDRPENPEIEAVPARGREAHAEERKLKGEAQKAEWGKQIRSYVLQPYKLVKDHRTEYETTDVDSVLDGDLRGFMEAYLRWLKK